MYWPHGAMIWGHDRRHFQQSNHLKLSTHVMFKKGEGRLKATYFCEGIDSFQLINFGKTDLQP